MKVAFIYGFHSVHPRVYQRETWFAHVFLAFALTTATLH
jgi:hypothetical protein